jgi:hypothetical protein
LEEAPSSRPGTADLFGEELDDFWPWLEQAVLPADRTVNQAAAPANGSPAREPSADLAAAVREGLVVVLGRTRPEHAPLDALFAGFAEPDRLPAMLAAQDLVAPVPAPMRTPAPRSQPREGASPPAWAWAGLLAVLARPERFSRRTPGSEQEQRSTTRFPRGSRGKINRRAPGEFR